MRIHNFAMGVFLWMSIGYILYFTFRYLGG